MRKVLPDAYDFYPKTWTLPLEKNEFLNEFKQRKKVSKKNSNWRYMIKNGNGRYERTAQSSKLNFLKKNIFFLLKKLKQN